MSYMKASRLIFAGTLIAIGIFGIVAGDFGAIWQPVPKGEFAREALAYLCGIISVGSGIGLLVRRTAVPSAAVLLGYLIVWTAFFKVPFILRAPLVEVSYQTNGENAVSIAAAWVLLVVAARGPKAGILNFVAGGPGLSIAYALYGLALLAFGFSHFAYLNLTVPLVPHWLPAPLFWAYFTGSVYVLTGLALLSGIAARAGAVGAAIQIALITLLVWGPVVLSGHMKPTDIQESVISWTLTAGAFVIAASFAGRPWFRRIGTTFYTRRKAAAA
jgi:uncharacterized membrane protein